MRIRGDKQDNSGSGGGSRDRSNLFKRSHHVGQKVRGRVVNTVADGLAWVDVDGHRLLAQLGGKPPVNSILTFQIQQLTPQIVLKVLFGINGVDSSTLDKAGSFEAARTLFESVATEAINGLQNTSSEERRLRFFSKLAKDSELALRFLDVVSCVNEMFKPTSNDFTMHYQPWRIPEGRRHITIVKRPQNEGSILTAITECELPILGMTRVESLSTAETVSVRVYAQRPAENEPLKSFLKQSPFGESCKLFNFLGVFKLPEGGNGGLLTEHIFNK